MPLVEQPRAIFRDGRLINERIGKNYLLFFSNIIPIINLALVNASFAPISYRKIPANHILSPMEFLTTKLPGVYYIKPKIFQDNRGFFLESYSHKVFAEHDISQDFVQDNHSMSVKKGVVRGLHFQHPPHTQSKLIRVTRGSVFDVVVDIRKESDTYGQWESFELTGDNFAMLYVPRGFAHGFCTLEDNTEFMYKNDNLYAPQAESGIRWNDPALNINWPVTDAILSAKDAVLPFFNDFVSPF